MMRLVIKCYLNMESEIMIHEYKSDIYLPNCWIKNKNLGYEP
jgi:hypothetical protein